MESSIAVFLMRQHAFERLPTSVGAGFAVLPRRRCPNFHGCRLHMAEQLSVAVANLKEYRDSQLAMSSHQLTSVCQAAASDNAQRQAHASANAERAAWVVVGFTAWEADLPLRRSSKLTWLVLGGDPAVCSRRVEQFTAL